MEFIFDPVAAVTASVARTVDLWDIYQPHALNECLNTREYRVDVCRSAGFGYLSWLISSSRNWLNRTADIRI